MHRFGLKLIPLLALLMLVTLACASDSTATPVPTIAVAPTPIPLPMATANPLTEMLQRARSDDANSVEEANFHSQSRATVILNVEPNRLRVGGREFRVKRNPVEPGGAFVYDPRTRFLGVARNLVWWVPLGELSALTAYPLNSPSKMVTPGLEFPIRAGVSAAPNTAQVVAYVFKGTPIPAPVSQTAATSNPNLLTYTVKEYRIYRELIDTPMSMSEERAIVDIGRRYRINANEVERIVKRVQRALSRNSWFGSAETEIRHASDWQDK